MSTIYYELAADSWDSSNWVVIKSCSSQVIAVFPIPFLQRCGTDGWTYIFEVIADLVDLTDVEEWYLVDQNGSCVPRMAAPTNGTFILQCSDNG